mgnify:FL=1
MGPTPSVTDQRSVAHRRVCQSALNNAADQRATSADGSASGAAAVSATPAHNTAPNNTESAANSASAAAAKFVAEWQGQFIDPDRSWGAQCFDVFRQYSNEVAAAAANIATDSDGVAQYYDRIPAGQGQPQAGDIIRLRQGAYGHVALVTGVSGSSYSVLEQNYTWQDNISGNDPAAVHTYSFSDTNSGVILGYLRPKNVHI